VRAFFIKRALREKVLLLAFVLLALVIWTGRSWNRSQLLWQDWRRAETELSTQQVWLNNAPAIDAAALAATQSLDPAKTLNATRLVGELNALASQAGLTADISAQRTENTSQFAFHAVQVTFRRTDLPALLKFYRELSKRAPYIGLEQFSLTTDRTNAGQLNSSFGVVSVELQR